MMLLIATCFLERFVDSTYTVTVGQSEYSMTTPLKQGESAIVGDIWSLAYANVEDLETAQILRMRSAENGMWKSGVVSGLALPER